MESPESNNKCCPSQLRYDEVSKDWVVIAPGRGKRPEAFKRDRIRSSITRQDCIFCNLEKQETPIQRAHGVKITRSGCIKTTWRCLNIFQTCGEFLPGYCSIFDHLSVSIPLTRMAGIEKALFQTRDSAKKPGIS